MTLNSDWSKYVSAANKLILIRRGHVIRAFYDKTREEVRAFGKSLFPDGDFAVLDTQEELRARARHHELLTAEVDVNIKSLEKDKRWKDLMKKHWETYVLMKNGEIHGYYNDKEEATVAGRESFKDGVFSVLELNRTPRVFYGRSRVESIHPNSSVPDEPWHACEELIEKRMSVTKLPRGWKPGNDELILMRRGDIVWIYHGKTREEVKELARFQFLDHDFIVVDEKGYMLECQRRVPFRVAEMRVNVESLEKDEKWKELLKQHPESSYVLMKDGRIFGYYKAKEEAAVAGRERFQDGIFSVLELDRSVKMITYWIPSEECTPGLSWE